MLVGKRGFQGLGSVLGVKIYEDSSVLGVYYGLYFLETS